MTDVSIILVNYNTQKITSECIDSIVKMTEGVSYEIILVDNDSKDGSKEAFAKDGRVKFIESGSNLGFGKANNLGVKHAQGKYIFFLNTDTLLLNNAVKAFFDYAEAHKDERLGSLGCVLVNGERKPTFSCGHFLKLKIIFQVLTQHFGHVPDIYGVHIPEDKLKEDAFDVDYVSGADIFVAKETVDKYGAFDPEFFMYYEETEMQRRWKHAGLTNRIIKGPEIVHLEGGSFKKKPVVNRRAYSKKALINRRSEMLFFKKSYSKPYYLLYRICFFLYVLNDALSRKELKFIKEELKLALTGDFE